MDEDVVLARHKLILMPCFRSNHWFLAAAVVQDNAISIFVLDSISSPQNSQRRCTAGKSLKQIIEANFKMKTGGALNKHFKPQQQIKVSSLFSNLHFNFPLKGLAIQHLCGVMKTKEQLLVFLNKAKSLSPISLRNDFP